MDMTDREILESWERAIDKREHVKILADRNAVKVWDMMEKLMELEAPGLDRRWYQNLNPARKKPKTVAAKFEDEPAPEAAFGPGDDERPSALLAEISLLEETLKERDREILELRSRGLPEDRFGVIRWFCRDLYGGGAFLMGRIVELLLDWKESGDADRLLRWLEIMMEEG